ncbi:MAG: TatD family hydrolase [Oscillospiraceae bacterium]|nr:TatD family hydrolase [Oscillospiraceae bacterium]
MYFDSHAHLDDSAFNEDRESLLAGLPARGVDRVLIPGCDLQSSRAAAALAEQTDWIWFAAGWHPQEAESWSEEGFEELKKLFDSRKCVAVGEIGLDYYWDTSRKEEQKRMLHAQLAFAVGRDLPVIIHDREAHGDCLEIVRRYPELRGVFHCFSGSAEMAEELLKMGWYLGFDGPVTYKNARKAVEVLEICPPERILLETDSPYLPPVPLRGKRNDPGNLSYICRRVAEIKGMEPEEMASLTARNACRLFGIG